MDSGWNLQHILRLIVTSATYRQSSQISGEAFRLDPDNRLLARGPRFRLKGEVIRDAALAVSGLLVHELGGPSVRPYQPKGLWVEVAVADDSYSGGPYVQSHGNDLYRRSVYTWWKRTCPPPALNTLDAPEREFCRVERSRTNTPLQALVLLNDPTFVEAARKLAERMLVEGGPETSDAPCVRFSARHGPIADRCRTGSLERFARNLPPQVPGRRDCRQPNCLESANPPCPGSSPPNWPAIRPSPTCCSTSTSLLRSETPSANWPVVPHE